MIEDLDDLTLVYMYGAKNGRDSMKAEIKRLRAALQAIAQCPIPARIPGRVELWSLAVQMQETAIAALKEGEASDD
jgi:hypothetical protein